MTRIQRMAVTYLFFLYGNSGAKFTRGNHHFLSAKLGGREDAEHYQPTEECITAFEAVMSGDWTSLPDRSQIILRKMADKEEYWRKVSGVSEMED